MTWNFSCLFNEIKIAPWPVSLPNVTIAFAEQYGKVQLGANLILNKVLYIYQLKCKLISIPQLMKSGLIQYHLLIYLLVLYMTIHRRP